MSAESHRGRKRVTRLVVVVVFAFALLWFPIQVNWHESETFKNNNLIHFQQRILTSHFFVFFNFLSLISLLQIILLLKGNKLFEICTNFHAFLQVFSHVVAYASSCINPVLYAFLSENFRKAFKKVSCGKRKLLICIYIIIFKSRMTGKVQNNSDEKLPTNKSESGKEYKKKRTRRFYV